MLKMKNKILLFLSVTFIFNYSFSQSPNKLSSNQIFEKIQKLNFLGTALYIAAHPDDENTRLIAYLANNVKARTAYLSLTRGDGGQNLIGPEIRELLGVIRTQELLAARKIDGGSQLFTRANDFGYSKHPKETHKIWNKEEVLADVVWAIRTFKPDVIINRFNHRTPGTTHGHHTSSAILSFDAFDKSADSTQYRSQLEFTDVWKPKRLFFNTSSWFYRNKIEFQEESKNFTKLDVGVYYPLKGLSNNEIASMASSQHLCQGFGRLTSRGSQNEFLEFLKGDELKDKDDIFSGINTTWNRIEGGGEIGDILYKIEENFDFTSPSTHIPELLKAYQLILNLKDEHWKNVKKKEVLEIIEACLGLYIEASAVSSSATPNSKIKINFEALNRSNIDVKLTSITSKIDNKEIFKGFDLLPNKKINFQEEIKLSTNSYSSPYWLNSEWNIGMYDVKNQSFIGNPETIKETNIDFNLIINYVPLTITKNIIRRYSERDKGEIYEPFEILPKVTTKLLDKVIIFSDSIKKKVDVEVRAGANYVTGEISLNVPENWQVYPKSAVFNVDTKNDKQVISFYVKPSKEESEGILSVIATSGEKKYTKELVEITYNHIPKQSVLIDSKAKVVRLDINKVGSKIGYIKGAGDAVPESLSQIGYNVEIINLKKIDENSLSNFDAIVLGIRAYNVEKLLNFKQKYLLEYVKNGGNLIVQYNTSRNVDIGAPFPLKLSRDRVTNENAEVTILDPDNSILNFPNKIAQEDFNGWVQERGLYFPNIWSEQYVPIFSMKDEGETPKLGSLLIADYGKGKYIYTGLSFFRELPAGVSGAYKLFANMLSAGKENAPLKLKH